jgi:tRNA pseudouridine32 synthase/23S rRNA pseudouridine746 synthase
VRSPFDEVEPDPRAVVAARALMQRLPPLAEGKMFGALVVEGGDPLYAFSGDAPLSGFVPHVYDAAVRSRIEPAADAIVKRLEGLLPSLAEHQAVATGLEAERQVLKALHAERRRVRHRPGRADPQASRADKRERRSFEQRAGAALAAFAPLVRRRAAIERLRRLVSREAMRRIHDSYVLENALGETAPLRSLFRGEPPWGAGECAAVKLVQYAIRTRRVPLALAEFWWGPPPPGGGRVHGAFYPACRTKCGPLLPFLLRGLEIEPRRAFRSRPAEYQLLHQDARVAVLAKPAGLLSVPGKEESDSVLERLRAKHPEAMLVHRLDLDTSGVLVAALDGETYRALQAHWREVEKRYVAWLEGELREERGIITLPMRVDLEQRPRQVVDFEHGLWAQTRWEVLERRGGRTRVVFFPRTGRTHQLRVHAAHPDGLGAPIVGDRLYGHEGERLMLHAEELTFTHPQTSKRMTFSTPAPF